MDNNKPAVEANAQPAAAGEGVKVVETPVENNQDINYESALGVVEEQLEKVRKERDSYKIGLLKAKGKLSDEELADEENRLRQIVREEFLATRESDLIQKKDNLLKQTLRENAELKTSLRSRAGIQTVNSSGNSQAKPEGKAQSFLSEEQKNELRSGKRGIKWTEDMINKLDIKLREKR